MAKIRKRTWTNKSGKHTCYEITYTIDGKQYRKSGYNSELEAQIEHGKLKPSKYSGEVSEWLKVTT